MPFLKKQIFNDFLMVFQRKDILESSVVGKSDKLMSQWVFLVFFYRLKELKLPPDVEGQQMGEFL